MRIVVKFIFKMLAIILYRPKIVGKENIPSDTGAIICANHVHALDSVLIIVTAKRKMHALAKEELFEIGALRWLAKVFEIYPVKRDNADMGAVKTSLKTLKNDELLLIFPEGTRNGIDRGIKPKNGPVTIAIKAGKPIIPVAFQGSFKPFTKVKINIGKPIDYSEYKEKISDKEFVSSLTDGLMKEIVRLREEKI